MGEYKALVCFFLGGGCDTNNLLIPIGSHPGRANYEADRRFVAVSENDISNAGTELDAPSAANQQERSTYGIRTFEIVIIVLGLCRVVNKSYRWCEIPIARETSTTGSNRSPRTFVVVDIGLIFDKIQKQM